jgi:hypothetical protein
LLLHDADWIKFQAYHMGDNKDGIFAGIDAWGRRKYGDRNCYHEPPPEVPPAPDPWEVEEPHRSGPQSHPDWPKYRVGLSVIRRVSPLMLATSTWETVAPYESQIRERNEAFFLTQTLAEGSIVETITKLRGLWSHLTPHNQSIVWDYITNITYLAKKCSETQRRSQPG